MHRTVLAAALSCCALASAAAQENKLAAVLPATPGGKACFTRSYDAKHLREHPRQRITGVTFFVRVVGLDKEGDWVLTPDKTYDRISYQFALSAQRRGEKRALTTSGYCPEENKDALCLIECDGGGAKIEKSGEGLMVRLLDYGIRMNGCEEDNSKWLKPGADDRAFRLDKAAPEQCAALENDEFAQ